MLQSLTVRHFQSLHDVHVVFGGLTIIVGPSSSGKSALTRALRTVVANRRGTAFIEHGERACTITAVNDRGAVTLLRGKTTTNDSYTVRPAQRDDPFTGGQAERVFTKLGGETPPEVAAFLGIDAASSLSHAGQFDRPYLLAEPGTVVAHTLASLTNAHLLLDAAKESNRRKLNASALLKTRTGDLESVRPAAAAVADLEVQGARLDLAEDALVRARDARARIDGLRAVMAALREASITLRRGEVAAPPSIEPIERIETDLLRVRYLLAEGREAALALKRAKADELAAQNDVEILRRQEAETIHEMGVCELCGQDTTHLEMAHG